MQYPENEDFKHFDLKWGVNNTQQVTYKIVEDEKTNNELVEASKLIYKSCNATGYARCDFRFLSLQPETHFQKRVGDSEWTQRPGNSTFWRSTRTPAFFTIKFPDTDLPTTFWPWCLVDTRIFCTGSCSVP